MDIVDGHHLVDGSDGGVSPCEEQWAFEGEHDPLDADEVRQFQCSSASQVAGLYLAMRKAVRQHRAAKGRFGPRRRFNGSSIERRFRRKGLHARFGGTARNGFSIGEAYVRLDHVLDEESEVSVRGRKGGGKTPSKCFECGKPGHFARERPCAHALRFKCHKFWA